jgi:site-specific DNA-cytosine methylase
MKQNIILDLCGGTGSWSEPFRKAGFNVIVLDIKNGYDITEFTWRNGELSFGWDEKAIWIRPEEVYGVLSAPPCTQFSFARTNAKEPRNLEEGMKIVEACLKIIWICQNNLKKDVQKKPHLKFWALENPNGMLKWFLGKPAFEFSPFEFGDDYKKKTHIWGDFKIPEKNPIECTKPKFDKLSSKEIHPEYYGKLTRQERRAITPKGFAEAFCKAQLKRGGKI